jgi:hypothetical protein
LADEPTSKTASPIDDVRRAHVSAVIACVPR